MDEVIEFVGTVVEFVGEIVEAVIDSVKVKRAEKRRLKPKAELGEKNIDLPKIDGKIIK